MPIRAFVSQNLTQLQTTLSMLEKALQSGSLQELRASGILTTTSPITQDTLQLRYNQCRYELFLRVSALDPADPNQPALMSQFGTNPYSEKVMKVHSRSSVGLYGQPFPAPFIPPSQ